MNDQTKQSATEETVLERIRSGEITMRPGSFFIAKVLFTLVVSLLVLLLSIWLASFISFDLRITGHESLLGFGSRGLALFFSIFPWGLATLDLILIALLVWMLQHFRFVYRTPLLFIIAILIVFGTASGLLFDRETGFHDDRFEEAEAGELPIPIQELYENVLPTAPEDQGIYRGYVTGIVSGAFLMTYDDNDHDEDDGTWIVMGPSGFDTSALRIGDKVYVAGDRDGKTIEAYGVRTLAR
ncbi:MAG: hypothetical protein AB199_01505 [Parcubacteria bacterium C7867-004]|nr:MAG: hypothetical protein AB199_01505 [Parcubacteria bacterium C7867-004]